ncbi:MAG: hypothetical protein ABI950_13060 [Solirubrobacteraceae bacterium]
MSHVRAWRWIVGVLVVAGLAALALSVRSDTSKQGEVSVSESAPARVDPIKGTDLSRVTLSAQAARRLGIRTAPVQRHGRQRKVIPYSAVLYDPEGRTFTYTSPAPLVFVRHPIVVYDIDGQRAFLSSGPPLGTAVATVGSQELFGTEYAVEED